MRDTSAWSGSIFTGKFTSAIELRRRVPGFRWYSGTDYYTIPAVGETWGDRPNINKIRRTGDLPDTIVHGRFVVLGDSVTLSNGNILRATNLASGNRGDSMYWYEVTEPNDLIDTYNTETFTSAPLVRAGFGIAEHTDPLKATAFFIRTSDGKMISKTYTSGSGWSGSFLYSNSPVLDIAGIAPISEDFGFVCQYDIDTHFTTLYNFDAGSWISQKMPFRFKQNIFNTQWFDAEPLGNNWLVTYCNNGTQMATIFDGTVFADPWPIFALDPEFGAAQTRICKLTTLGDKIVGTAWSRFANGSGDYDVSYYHLVWTEDGYNWAIPEYGYIGQTASRGKLHIMGDNVYIIGGSVCYVGDAVVWLGGTVGTTTLLGSRNYENQVTQDLNSASEFSISAAMETGDDKTLFEYGNEAIFSIGIDGESNVDVGKFVIDTPGNELTDRTDEMQIVGRGPLKELISFSAPIDRTFEGPRADYQSFEEGGVYARWGDWSTENGVAYCETHDGESSAVATVGTQYRGQFQINTRLRLTAYADHASGGVVFWYEGPQDFYYFFITGDSSSRAIVRRLVAGESETLVNVSVTGGVTAGTWYDACIRYQSGVLYIWLKPDGGSWQSITVYDDWDTPEPQHWYTGLYAELPRTTTTAELTVDATHKVDAVDTHLFPSAGYIRLDDENIYYPSKTSTQFGAGQNGSIIRGIRSTRISHPAGSNVHVADCRVEFSSFTIYEINRAMSVAEACKFLVTTSGIDCDIVKFTTAGPATADSSSQSHGWIVDGEYSGNFSLFFWTSSTATPTSGIEIRVTTTTISVYDVVGGFISSYPASIASSGTFRCYAKYNAVILWCNGAIAGCVYIPGDTPRTGAVYVDAGVTSLTIAELAEPVDAFAWVMQETARDVISRLIEGRDAYLHETYEGNIKITLLNVRPDLGTLNGTYFLSYLNSGSDQDWASAMVAWGAEDWVMVVEPTADRLRWTQWQAPYIYDQVTLKDKAMERLRKLWALRSIRFVQGPFDPRIEVGDELYINEIRGVAAGSYIVRNIVIKHTDRTLDMEIGIQATPVAVPQATWDIVPGVDRPTRA